MGVTAPASRLPEFTVRRSARARRGRVTVRETGDAVVVLPQRAPADAAVALVTRHAAWISRHQAAIAERRAALAARPALGEGRCLPLEGVPHTVTVYRLPPGASRSRVELDELRRAIRVVLASSDTRPASVLLEAWLRRLARRWLAERVSELASQVGVEPRRVTIRDQRSRWGSATQGGTLSFSWRLVFCPPEVLHYVVVHELCHLVVAGHGRGFWSLVERHVPDAPGARRWLREHHAEVRHALD